VGVGVFGYVAAMEWRRVQLQRPRAATSGGQSLGGAAVRAAVWEVNAAKELQERQLEGTGLVIGRWVAWGGEGGAHGFPSFPRMTPLGYFLGGEAVVVAVLLSSVASARTGGVSSAAMVERLEVGRLVGGA